MFDEVERNERKEKSPYLKVWAWIKFNNSSEANTDYNNLPFFVTIIVSFLNHKMSMNTFFDNKMP